jgi:hypothetical protein
MNSGLFTCKVLKIIKLNYEFKTRTHQKPEVHATSSGTPVADLIL